MVSRVDVTSLQGKRCRCGTCAVERAEGSGKAGSLLLSWAMALLCAVDAWEETPYHYSTRTSLPPHGNP